MLRRIDSTLSRETLTRALAPSILWFSAVFLLQACGNSDDRSAAAPPPAPPALPTEFVVEGLDGRRVNGLFPNGDRVFATTDRGIYARSAEQANWQFVALEDRRAVDLVFLNTSHWFAAVFDAGAEAFKNPALLETVNQGSNWERVTSDFGGMINANEPMFALLRDEETGTLYATGWNKGGEGPQPLVLEVSTDGGASFVALEYEDPNLRGGALSLLPIVSGELTVVLIGLDGGGVVRVENAAAM